MSWVSRQSAMAVAVPRPFSFKSCDNLPSPTPLTIDDDNALAVLVVWIFGKMIQNFVISNAPAYQLDLNLYNLLLLQSLFC